MTDIDIQTAQLIIQLARDDLYGLDGSPDDASLSDLEFALAAQEHEFMQYWMNYGDAQVTPTNRTGAGFAGSGTGSNVGSPTTSAVRPTPVSPIPQPPAPSISSRRGPGPQSPASSSSNTTLPFPATGSFRQANLFWLNPQDEDEYEEEPHPAWRPSTSTLPNLRPVPPAPAQGATWQEPHSASSSQSSVNEVPILPWTLDYVPAFGSESIVRETHFYGEESPPDSPASEVSNLDDEEPPVPEWPVLMTPPAELPTTAEEPPLVDYVDYAQYTLQQPISPISTRSHSDSDDEEEPTSSLFPFLGGESSEDDAGRASRVETISRILDE